MSMGMPGETGAQPNTAAVTPRTPTAMARMLGLPPTTMQASAGARAPGSMGAAHIYHLAADSFFLGQPTAVGLTSEQQTRLSVLREDAAVAYATTQRKIDQGEQDLWVLVSSEVLDLKKIEANLAATARLMVQQRLDYLRSVEAAVGVLSHAQHRAVVSQGPPAQATPMPPAAGASGMSPPVTAAAPGGMEMGGPAPASPAAMAPGSGMPSPAPGMGDTADAGSAGAMGHM